MFGTGLTGAYGGVAWLIGAPDLGAVEAAVWALTADDEWRKVIDRAAADASRRLSRHPCCAE